MITIAKLFILLQAIASESSGNSPFPCDVGLRRYNSVAPEAPKILGWRIERGDAPRKLLPISETRNLGNFYFRIDGIPDDFNGESELGYYVFKKGGDEPPPYSLPDFPINNFLFGELTTIWPDQPPDSEREFKTDVAIAAVDSACNYSELTEIIHLNSSTAGCTAMQSRSQVSPVLFGLLLVCLVLTRRWS